MTEQEYKHRFNRLIAEIAALPEQVRAPLVSLAAETDDRHRKLRRSHERLSRGLGQVEIVTNPLALEQMAPAAVAAG